MPCFFCFLLPFLQYFEPFCHILHLFTPFCCKIRNMHISRGEIIEKIIISRKIGIFLIIGKNIDIGLRHPQIIGDLKKLLAKLSISKLTANLSKKMTYRAPLEPDLSAKSSFKGSMTTELPGTRYSPAEPSFECPSS